MPVLLLVVSAALEAAGITGTFLTPTESLPFILCQRAIDLGGVGLALSYFLWRRRSVEAAYEIGIEVGVRRGRKAARGLTVVSLPTDDDGKRRSVAGQRRH